MSTEKLNWGEGISLDLDEPLELGLHGGAGFVVVVKAPDGEFKGALAGVAASGENSREAVLVGKEGGVEGSLVGAILPKTVEHTEWPALASKDVRPERELKAVHWDKLHVRLRDQFVS